MTAYTLFGQQAPGTAVQADATAYTFGMEFSLSQAATLTGIWWFSPPGGALPVACAVYRVSNQTIVAGSENDTPVWSGAAGSGWLKCPYAAGPVLAAGVSYKVAVLGPAANWYSLTSHYWDTGAGQNGLTAGIITAPNNAGGDGGQDTLHANPSFLYPNTSFNASNYWVDVEVSVSSGLVTGDDDVPWHVRNRK